MKIINWLNITAKHELYEEDDLYSFGIFPDTETQKKLKSHRHLWNFDNGKLNAKFFTQAKDNLSPEIAFLNSSVTLKFILATKDSNFQLITKDLQIPFFYENFRHEITIDKNTNTNNIIEVVFVDGIKYKPSPIQLPNGYQSIGILCLTINDQLDFFNNIINRSSPLIINFLFKSAAYHVLIEIEQNIKSAQLPEIVEDDSGYAQFTTENVDNNKSILALSIEPINLSNSNKLSIQSYYISTDKEKKRIKHKNVRFSIDDLTNHPSYPHYPLLYKKVKF